MFKACNPILKLPKLYPLAERVDPSVDTKGYDKVGSFTLRDKVDLMPQRGLQESLCSCESNLIFICGEKTSGKTFGMMQWLLCGVGKKDYTGRMISVRLQDSKKGSSIHRDAMRVWGEFGGCQSSSSDYPTFYWPQWNNSIQLIHSNYNVSNPSEWLEFTDYAKKQQASRIAIDEATEMREFKMFSYWFSRNRDDSGMIPSMCLSFNPEHEHWTTRMLMDAGCIGPDWFLIPEMDGVTKYFYVKGDTVESIVWGNSKQEVVDAVGGIYVSDLERKLGLTELDMVKSFTMLTGEAAGNMKLVAATKGQSVANLHAVGESQRAIAKRAYFGPIDREELAVSRQMIHNLWTNPVNDDENMYATLDVSSGVSESDLCPMIIWKGLQIVAIRYFRSDAEDPDALPNWISGILNEYNIPVKNFAFDATGIGWYLKKFKEGMSVTFNKRPVQEVDAYGNPVTLEMYVNLRSQLLGKMKVLLERGEVSVALDKNTLLPCGKKGQKRELINILFDEINVFVKQSKNGKIYYRSKDEFKAKFRRSPDLMDAIFIRAIFELDARPKKQPEPEVPDDAYDDIFVSLNPDRLGRILV